MIFTKFMTKSFPDIKALNNVKLGRKWFTSSALREGAKSDIAVLLSGAYGLV